MRRIMERPDTKEHVVHCKTPEEMALLAIGANLSQEQFDHMCKKEVFGDDAYASRWLRRAGFAAVKASLPVIMFLAEPFPGCCFNPADLVPRVLEVDGGRLEFRAGTVLKRLYS